RARGRARAGRLRGGRAGRIPRPDVRAGAGTPERGGPGRELALPRAGGRPAAGARAGGAGGCGVCRSAGGRRGGGERRVAPRPARGHLRPPRSGGLSLVAARGLRRARPRPGRGASPAALARGPARVRAARLRRRPRDLALQRAGAARRPPPLRRGVHRLDGQARRHRVPLHPPRERHAVGEPRAGAGARQALATCNAVADTLGPGGRVFHLAYHDTLEPPRAVRPDPRVWAEFAPRERCYAHALDDPACATNAAYRRALDAHLELFAGRVHVFEYYGDAILFGGCAVPLAEVVERDLDYYARAGVRGVSCLVFGQ